MKQAQISIRLERENGPFVIRSGRSPTWTGRRLICIPCNILEPWDALICLLSARPQPLVSAADTSVLPCGSGCQMNEKDKETGRNVNGEELRHQKVC